MGYWWFSVVLHCVKGCIAYQLRNDRRNSVGTLRQKGKKAKNNKENKEIKVEKERKLKKEK